MHRHLTSGWIAVVLLFSVSAVGAELVLADGGRSAYRIVVAEDASPSTKHAAAELQSFLEQISGAKLPVVSDREPATEREILLGDSARLQALKLGIDFKPLGAEGYVLRTVGNRLVIAGGKQRGNLYGVYGLLEDHLGCRWFAPGVSRIPKQPRLVLGKLDERQVPALEYREVFTFDCFDGDWCARNRVNSSSARLEAKHGGKVKFADGFFVHTFERLWVWDYVTDFRNYWLPFPNQRVRDQNIRFFIRHNVKGIFEQDTYNTPHSEMVEVGGYLTAKFLWNANYDRETVIKEFLEGYYGKAAGPIRAYLDLLHDRVEKENIHVNIWAEPTSPHLTDELLVKANEPLKKLAVERFAPFIDMLKASGATRLNDWSTLNLDDYRQKLAAAYTNPKRQ